MRGGSLAPFVLFGLRTMRMSLLVASLALSATAVATSGCAMDEMTDDSPACIGKCDGAAPRTGVLYAPQYTHSTAWAGDGRYGTREATTAANALLEKGWDRIEVIPVKSVAEMLADLDDRADNSLGLVGTVSHAGPGGPLFRDKTARRNTVQMGWSWYGDDVPVSRLDNGGPVDSDGLVEMTDRFKRVVHPEGMVFFSGCRTGAQTVASVPRSRPVSSAYADGTPFFIEGETPARRYKTFVHAVADLTGRVTAGSKVRMNLNLTDDVLLKLYYGGENETRGLPSYYISVAPTGGKADQMAAEDDRYVYQAEEGAYEASGSCDETTGECDSEDARWGDDRN